MPASEALPLPIVAPPALGKHVLLYDGVCGLCSRTVRWMLRHDPEGRLLFAPQQWPVVEEIFARHSLDKDQVNSVVLVSSFGQTDERLTVRSNAVLACLNVLGGGWAVLAAIVRLIPRALRDAGYGWIARNRRRLFGTVELCTLPEPAERDRFLGY